MFTTSSTAGPLPSIDRLESIARKTGLIKRHSARFSGHGFLLSLIQSVVRGSSSLNQIAFGLSRFEDKAMSRQAVHQRLGDASTRFLSAVLSESLQNRTGDLFPAGQGLPFLRLLIEDCTVLSMHKSNNGDFPGGGNGMGHTAGAKIQLTSDWLSGDVLGSDLHTARSADRGLSGDILGHCRAGDLVVRDMGFFHLPTLRDIGAADAFWLSRLPVTVTALGPGGESLDDRLKKERRGGFEMTVLLGRDKRTRCRLVATRLSPEQAEKNRRERRRSSRRRGSTASKIGLLRDGWRILVTNLTKIEASHELLESIYNLRWNIEIQFRALKQSCRIEKALGHRAGRCQLEALVYAIMIYQVLTLTTHRLLKKTNGKTAVGISYEKLCDALAIHLTSITKWNLLWPFDPDRRHLCHDRRRRQTLEAKGIRALT